MSAQTGTKECLKCRPLELLTIIHESLKALEEETKVKNLVLAEGLRNGHLAYRPNWKTMKLEPTDDEGWRQDLPGLAESHRLKKAWAQDRLKWRDEAGVPVEPVLKTKTCKGLGDFEDNASVAGPHEVTVHADEDAADGEPVVEGPVNKIAGTKIEEEQLVFGVFSSLDDSLKQDFIAMGLKQICLRSRLKEKHVQSLLTSQSMKGSNKRKRRMESKMLRGKVKSAALAAWRKSSRAQLQSDGVSRAEIMETLVPAVGKGKSLKAHVASVSKKAWFPNENQRFPNEKVSE